MSPEITKIIEQYLQNELSAADRAVFEQRLATNDQLLTEVVLQQRLHEAAKRSAQRQLVKQTAKRYHLRKQLLNTAIVVIAASAIAATVWIVAGKTRDEAANMQEAEFLQLQEQLKEKLPIAGIPVEYFNLAQQDTIVLSEEGVLLSIPEGAFLLGGKPYAGPKVVQWQEALGIADIVRGGLTTFSGSKLLETQGMFGLAAFTPEGKQLDINPKVGVYVQLPVDELKNGMQLYEGVKGKNGVIDWQNPKPLEKLPVMADMKDLDFYPPGYEKTLDDLKWKTAKKSRDSLYLSFEGEESEPAVDDRDEAMYAAQPLSSAEPHWYPIAAAIDTSWNQVARPLKESAKTMQNNAMRCYMGTISVTQVDVFDVEFSCVMLSASKARLQISGTIESARKVEGKGPKNNIFNLRTEKKDLTITHYGTEIRHAGKTNKCVEVYDIYLNKGGEIDAPASADFRYYGPAGFVTGNFEMDIRFVFNCADTLAIRPQGHIPPSKVLAFWQPKFNNTLLATRDFERRMQSVHGTCAENVLSQYTNNLNKPLHEIDAAVAAMGYPQFAAFAEERVGAVKLDNPHMNNLRRFYASATTHLRKEMQKDKAFVRKQEMAWDNHLSRARTKEAERAGKRNRSNFVEEYVHNQAAIIQQLGRNVVGVTINRSSPSNTWNIDKIAPTVSVNGKTVANPDLVLVTINRKTQEYSNAAGKTASVVYSDFSVSVKSLEKYGKLLLYLFPRELNSFIRRDPQNGKFSYRLNDGLTYDIALVAIGEEGCFIYERQNVRSGDLGPVVPEKVSEMAFTKRLEALNGNSSGRRMKIGKELDWLVREQQNYAVQRLRMENRKFRQRLQSVIFPCMEETGMEEITLGM